MQRLALTVASRHEHSFPEHGAIVTEVCTCHHQRVRDAWHLGDSVLAFAMSTYLFTSTRWQRTEERTTRSLSSQRRFSCSSVGCVPSFVGRSCLHRCRTTKPGRDYIKNAQLEAKPPSWPAPSCSFERQTCTRRSVLQQLLQVQRRVASLPVTIRTWPRSSGEASPDPVPAESELRRAAAFACKAKVSLLCHVSRVLVIPFAWLFATFGFHTDIMELAYRCDAGEKVFVFDYFLCPGEKWFSQKTMLCCVVSQTSCAVASTVLLVVLLSR